jgi:menaquinone-dependent protoporphyrinogen oxidase
MGNIVKGEGHMIGIFYASKYGFTKKVVGLIQDKCDQQTKAIDLSKTSQDVLSQLRAADKVLIGGSVYMGKIQKSVTQFLENYKEELQTKEVLLFISGLQNKDTIQVEMDQNFPLIVLDHAKAVVWLGGGVDFDKMSWIDKMITKKVMKKDESFENIQYDSIDEIIAFCNES